MTSKALIEYANDALILSNGSLKFRDLFDKAISLSGLELTESELKSKMASLYTQLTCDGRFALLSDGTWDLRSRHSFEQVHVNLDAFEDDDVGEDDEEEKNLLKAELGEVPSEDDKDDSSDSDDIDFDKPKKDVEDEDY
ncbi:MAG TPA: DNA-directed RNA polymerase subunit delta [Firmicutes bacterium]|nr:DNA-directed RNA polymerase subunit delta [Bacillota bacterium]